MKCLSPMTRKVCCCVICLSLGMVEASIEPLAFILTSPMYTCLLKTHLLSSRDFLFKLLAILFYFLCFYCIKIHLLICYYLYCFYCKSMISITVLLIYFYYDCYCFLVILKRVLGCLEMRFQKIYIINIIYYLCSN